MNLVVKEVLKAILRNVKRTEVVSDVLNLVVNQAHEAKPINV